MGCGGRGAGRPLADQSQRQSRQTIIMHDCHEYVGCGARSLLTNSVPTDHRSHVEENRLVEHGLTSLRGLTVSLENIGCPPPPLPRYNSSRVVRGRVLPLIQHCHWQQATLAAHVAPRLSQSTRSKTAVSGSTFMTPPPPSNVLYTYQRKKDDLLLLRKQDLPEVPRVHFPLPSSQTVWDLNFRYHATTLTPE